MIILRVFSGTSQASNMARYWFTTASTPSRSVSDPKTILINALGSLFGVFTVHSALCHSVADHQNIFLNSARRPCILVNVEPLRSKNTFGFQRETSAAHSYSGLPQCAPSTVIFGKRRAISSKCIGRIRPDATSSGSSNFSAQHDARMEQDDPPVTIRQLVYRKIRWVVVRFLYEFQFAETAVTHRV